MDLFFVCSSKRRIFKRTLFHAKGGRLYILPSVSTFFPMGRSLQWSISQYGIMSPFLGFSLNRLKDFIRTARNILKKAQQDLFFLYQNEVSDVWFDFQPGPRKGRGGKISSILIYVFSRKRPMVGLNCLWQKDDEP